MNVSTLILCIVSVIKSICQRRINYCHKSDRYKREKLSTHLDEPDVYSTFLFPLKWKKHISEQWVGTVFGIKAVDGKGARVIVGTRDNKIYGLDKTGEKLWDFTTEYVVRQVYAQDINADGKVEVIAGSEDRYVYALDSENGNLLWKYATDGWIRSVYAHDIDGDGQSEILAGSGDKYLYVLDSRGQLKWKHDAKWISTLTE